MINAALSSPTIKKKKDFVLLAFHCFCIAIFKKKNYKARTMYLQRQIGADIYHIDDLGLGKKTVLSPPFAGKAKKKKKNRGRREEIL